MRVVIICLMLSGSWACRHESHALSAPSGLDISQAPKGRTFTDLGEYLIDTSDLISVQVDNKKEVNGIYKVTPTGTLSLPLVGLMRAKGLTEAQLRESLVLKLRPLVAVPRVNVNLTQANSYVVYFSGKVQKPGTYKLDARTTLLQGLALAGGLRTEEASRVIIIREGADGSKKRFETTYARVRDGQGSLDNFQLERGDLVLID